MRKKGGTKDGRGFHRRNWKERYFVLQDGIMRYYESDLHVRARGRAHAHAHAFVWPVLCDRTGDLSHNYQSLLTKTATSLSRISQTEVSHTAR